MEGGNVGNLPDWAGGPHGCAKMLRVIRELIAHCEDTRRVLREPTEFPEFVDDAEGVKGALAQLVPLGPQDWRRVLSKSPAFWNRIALSQLRFEGGKYWYAIVRSLDRTHDLLTLRVPPKSCYSDEARR